MLATRIDRIHCDWKSFQSIQRYSRFVCSNFRSATGEPFITMTSKIIYWIVWLAFILYTFLFAPDDYGSLKSTKEYVKQLVFGSYGDIDAYIISLFLIMGKEIQDMTYFLILTTLFIQGIWPMTYLTVLLVDGQYQKLNGTLSALLSNLFGAWIILPYFGLRRSEKAKEFRMNIFIRIFESKITTALLIMVTIGLIGFALVYGDFRVFIHEFRTNWFIHSMTIDFFILSAIFPFLIEDDLKRRQVFDKHQYSSYFRLAFMPLIGPLIYLFRRSPLSLVKNE